jgi:hypothetical protein
MPVEHRRLRPKSPPKGPQHSFAASVRECVGCRRLTAVAVLAAVAASASVSSSVGARPLCAPSGAQTIVKDRVARIYKRYSRADRAHEVFGCSYRTGHRTFLGNSDFSIAPDGEHVKPISLRGPYVAANDRLQDHDTGLFATVSVFDLRTGKLLHRWSQGGGACTSATEVTALLVDGVGSAAWIAQVEGGCGPTTQEVYKADGKSRHAKLLGSATTIDQHFLELKNHKVFWKDGGHTHSAAIR